MNIIRTDCRVIHQDFLKILSVLKSHTVVITGCTGLIGQYLVKALLYWNEIFNLDIHIIGLVRDVNKAKTRFANCPEDVLNLLTYDDFFISKKSFNFLIHLASPTSSEDFFKRPVETVKAIVFLGYKLLEVAKDQNISSMVFASTMEIYGTNSKKTKIKENDYGFLDILNVRNSYPEAKRLIELLCVSYAKEFSVPVKIARLTQCFGPGVDISTDNRVFAQFARSVLTKQDITLHTNGATERCYVDVYDAIVAILYILVAGKNSSAYNIANPDTYMSIKEMAEMLSKRYGVGIRYEVHDNSIYCAEQHINLDITSLINLGWKPTKNLDSTFDRMIRCYLED